MDLTKFISKNNWQLILVISVFIFLPKFGISQKVTGFLVLTEKDAIYADSVIDMQLILDKVEQKTVLPVYEVGTKFYAVGYQPNAIGYISNKKHTYYQLSKSTVSEIKAASPCDFLSNKKDDEAVQKKLKKLKKWYDKKYKN